MTQTDEPKVQTPKPTEFELHLCGDSDFPKKFGKRIKALKGRYSACRGDQTTRYVHLPIETPEAQALINEIIKDNGNYFTKKPKTTVVLRGERDFINLPSNCVVIDVPPLAEDPFKWVMSHFDLYMQTYFKKFPAFALNYVKRQDEIAAQKLADAAESDINGILSGNAEHEKAMQMQNALLVIATCPHIRQYLGATDPMALKQVEAALGDLAPTKEEYPKTFEGDAKLIPDQTKINIERAINERRPTRFTPDFWAKVVPEKADVGDYDDYIVAGTEGGKRVCYLASTYSPFPRNAVNRDVVHLDEIKRLY